MEIVRFNIQKYKEMSKLYGLFSLNQMRRVWPNANKLFVLSRRSVNLQIPEERNEFLIRTLYQKNKLEESFDKINLPFKMRRHPEESKQFLQNRLKTNPDGFSPINVEDYAELYRHITNDEERNRIIYDIDMVVMYYNRVISKSIFCPSSIPLQDMKNMLEKYDSYSERCRYVNFIFIREFDNWKDSLKYEMERKIRHEEERLEQENFGQIGCFDKNGELQYGYWKNTMFTRYFDKSVQLYSLNRLRTAHQFGQKIVIDFSFDDGMADYETTSVARQVSRIYLSNRYSMAPFHLLFCGYQPTSRGYQYLRKYLKDIIDNKAYFFDLHQEPYEQLITDERFIYLSPDSRKLMTEFDHNAVYIIGGLVSKTKKSKLTYEKAREQGIETLRLPIHQYVQLKPGVKRVLSFQGVFDILLELKQHGDWHRAFRAGIAPHKLIQDGDSVVGRQQQQQQGITQEDETDDDDDDEEDNNNNK